MRIHQALGIERPPEDVFDFLIDTDNFRVVDRAIITYTPDGVMHRGLSGTFVHSRNGFRAHSTWKVEELERPSRLRIAVRGMGYVMDEEVMLAATATGTQATIVDSVRPTSIVGRILVAASGGIMRRDLSARAARLKSTLEAVASDP
jgi:hypothetical protein